MGCACTVISTDSPGSVPYLIKNRVNGMIVDVSDFPKASYELLLQPGLCMEMSIKAYRTICDEWNHKIAAKRLAKYVFAEKAYDEGPLSYT